MSEDLDFLTRFKSEIEYFMMGKDPVRTFHDRHVWVARHQGYEALVIEPLEGLGAGSQYVVAVRLSGFAAENGPYPHPVYVAVRGGYMHSYGAGGF